MSQETYDWLNNYTLIGNTDQRGHAWHYRESEQGAEPNHYPQSIPVEDVNRRLFNWEAIESPVYYEFPLADGNMEMRCDNSRKVILRSDTGAVLGSFKESYQGHGYSPWLLDQVAVMLDDDLGISSAGLLKGGAQAWVEVSVPETITTPEGVEFRPNLLATTSFDGTLATTYKRSFNDTVCDNTRAMVLAGAGEQFKVKHTKNSGLKILEAREALNMIHTMADAFAAEVAELCNIEVTDGDWAKFLAEIAPIPEEEGRGQTQAENKQGELSRLWRYDNRVAPWTGTAYGVIQAVNTYAQHHAIVRGHDGMSGNDLRAMRNAEKTVSGAFDTLDQETYTVLSGVLALA